MKKTLLSLLFIGTLNSISIAQKISADNVPASVNASFKTRFSIAKKTSWELDYDKYEADFKVGKSSFSAMFDKDGKWLETTSYIKPSELPKVIREAVSKKYGELSAYKIQEAEKKENEKEVIYELDVKKGGYVYELELNEAGEVMKDEQKDTTKK